MHLFNSDGFKHLTFGNDGNKNIIFTEVKNNKRRINTPIIKLEYKTQEFSHGDVTRIEYELLTVAINIKSYFVNSHGTRLFVEFNLEQRG